MSRRIQSSRNAHSIGRPSSGRRMSTGNTMSRLKTRKVSSEEAELKSYLSGLKSISPSGLPIKHPQHEKKKRRESNVNIDWAMLMENEEEDFNVESVKNDGNADYFLKPTHSRTSVELHKLEENSVGDRKGTTKTKGDHAATKEMTSMSHTNVSKTSDHVTASASTSIDLSPLTSTEMSAVEHSELAIGPKFGPLVYTVGQLDSGVSSPTTSVNKEIYIDKPLSDDHEEVEVHKSSSRDGPPPCLPSTSPVLVRSKSGTAGPAKTIVPQKTSAKPQLDDSEDHSISYSIHTDILSSVMMDSQGKSPANARMHTGIRESILEEALEESSVIYTEEYEALEESSVVNTDIQESIMEEALEESSVVNTEENTDIQESIMEEVLEESSVVNTDIQESIMEEVLDEYSVVNTEENTDIQESIMEEALEESSVVNTEENTDIQESIMEEALEESSVVNTEENTDIQESMESSVVNTEENTDIQESMESSVVNTEENTDIQESMESSVVNTEENTEYQHAGIREHSAYSLYDDSSFESESDKTLSVCNNDDKMSGSGMNPDRTPVCTQNFSDENEYTETEKKQELYRDRHLPEPTTSYASRKKEHHKQYSTSNTATQTLPDDTANFFNLHSWTYPTVSVGPHKYGGQGLDAPLLVQSADTPKVSTTYTPNMLALNDMLRSQLRLTRQLLETHRSLLASLTSTLKADHHYTTLQDTRRFIQSHRPKVLTFSEAKMKCSRKRK